MDIPQIAIPIFNQYYFAASLVALYPPLYPLGRPVLLALNSRSLPEMMTFVMQTKDAELTIWTV
jgi:hypothetical protein